jgi:DNA-binding transcriptional regulator YhcF (GntR family)
MDRGSIELYRKIQDNPFWRKKPFSPGQAMVDLLLRATRKPYDKLVGLKIIHLEPGQLFTSYRNLAKDWGWTMKKVRRFLDSLEKENFLERTGTEMGTRFTIVNWHTYQNLGHTEGTQKGTHFNSELENLVENGAHERAHLQEIIYKGNYFSVTESQHQTYADAYPGLELINEYKKMEAWLESNPDKRKKDRGYPRFINNWLAKAHKQTKKDSPGNWFDKYPKF